MLIFSMLKNVSNQNFLILKLSKRVWTQKKTGQIRPVSKFLEIDILNVCIQHNRHYQHQYIFICFLVYRNN